MTTSPVIATSLDEIRIPAMMLLRGGGQWHAAWDEQKCGRECIQGRERSSTKTEKAKQVACKPSQQAPSYSKLATPDRSFYSKTVHMKTKTKIIGRSSYTPAKTSCWITAGTWRLQEWGAWHQAFCSVLTPEEVRFGGGREVRQLSHTTEFWLQFLLA